MLTHETARLAALTESVERARLQSVADQIDTKVRRIQDELMQSLQSIPSGRVAAELSRWEQRNPLVRNVFIFAQTGLLLPDPALPRTQEQQGFIQRYQPLFNGTRTWPESIRREEESPASSYKIYSRAVRIQKSRPKQPGGWMPWYWENQFGLLGWTQADRTSPRYGMELEMMALLAELNQALPDNLSATQLMTLTDPNGRMLYQAGGLALDAAVPAIRIAVQTLPHWEVVLHTSTGNFGRASYGYALLSGLLISILFIALFSAGGLLLREAQRSRNDAEQKTTFVSNVSHELKTPLTTIRMYAELLGSGRISDPEKTARYLQTIVAESQRLTRLVNNVLHFSRLEQNRTAYQIHAFDLSAICRELVESQRMRIQNAGMELSVQLPEQEVQIQSDRDAVQQVILNLIDNAVKYAASGKKLRVELIQNEQIMLLISDAGPGIAAQHQRKIFDRFYRIDDSITAEKPGCGLGLSMARRMLADLQAQITYQPAPLGGASFMITFPAGAPPA